MLVRDYIMFLDRQGGICDSNCFNSVGIDIGSTTTQFVFSKLTTGFLKEKHKYDIVKREVTYISDIFLTPFNDSYEIDDERLFRILSSAYGEAGYEPDDIDTGAIIITGVAARRQNAEKIVNLFADQMGKFVCATAGPNYEAVLAANGSGAVERSDRYLKTVMNVDVGGGTTKIAVARKGEVVDTTALYVGARHVVLDEGGRLIRIEEPAEVVAETARVRLAVGEELSADDQRKLSEILADCLFGVLGRKTPTEITERLMITPPLSYSGKIDTIVFSGGVSEYIYGYESKSFGDLGIILGEEIRRRIRELDAPVAEPVERIRATVIGESQYTLQLSGTTNLISSTGLLPMRNLPVVAPHFSSSILTQDEIEDEMERAIEMHDIDIALDPFALAFRRSVISQPSYKLMKKLSEAVIAVLEGKVKMGGTVVLVFEADIGMGIGRVIQEEVAPCLNLISIDEVKLGDFNYIDIGEPTGKRSFIPVVVKSLIFPNQVKR
jgi:ethanolamine utilization protein EutA